MQISGLIRDLERIKDKHGDCEVLIGQTNYRHGGHTYSISDYMMAAKEDEPELEHTCDGYCICSSFAEGEEHDDSKCPVCDCEACNTDDVVEPVVYLMEGDQNSYALPSELVSTGHV